MNLSLASLCYQRWHCVHDWPPGGELGVVDYGREHRPEANQWPSARRFPSQNLQRCCILSGHLSCICRPRISKIEIHKILQEDIQPTSCVWRSNSYKLWTALPQHHLDGSPQTSTMSLNLLPSPQQVDCFDFYLLASYKISLPEIIFVGQVQFEMMSLPGQHCLQILERGLELSWMWLVFEGCGRKYFELTLIRKKLIHITSNLCHTRKKNETKSLSKHLRKNICQENNFYFQNTFVSFQFLQNILIVSFGLFVLFTKKY